MNVFIEILITTFQFLFHWMWSILKFILPFSHKKSLKGETVLITGAGSGIGRLMSIEFAKRGCTLVLWDINREGNEETAEQARRWGVSAYTYVCDLSKREAIYKCADKVKNDVGDVDILVNNAGIVTGKSFLECPDALIEKTMEVNVHAHFWTVKSFLPRMLERNHGHVVSIASSAGLFGVTSLADYCASKFAAVGFDESIRTELHGLKKNGVKTTVVCPFYINTGMFDGVKTRFMPILDPDYAVGKIMSAIETNQEVLIMPRIVYLLLALKGIMPVKCAEPFNNLLGMHDSMTAFVGRSKQQ